MEKEEIGYKPKPLSLKHLLEQFSYGLDAVEEDFLGVSRYHGKRVGLYCLAIGRQLGYDDRQLFTLAGCALLHDNALTEYLISERPGDAQEFNRKAHCIKGQHNCQFFPFPTNPDGLVLYHHEYADGSGAFGKKVGEYPREAGIIAMADQLDAGFGLWRADTETIHKVGEHLRKYRGIRYEEQIVDVAEEVLTEEFIGMLRDDAVIEAFSKEMPEVSSCLSVPEIIRTAGICAEIIDYKSSFTKEHTMQIANKAWYMGGVYRYTDEIKARIYLASALHDMGKLFIPTAILEKPGKLTEDEFEQIKAHALYTWECLKNVEGMEDIARWASEHHEKLDGSGYPYGKRGEDLDFVSRLIACLDIYQAVREARPYHPERSHSDTIEILRSMVENGYIDSGIVDDLDENLSMLPGGRAPAPSYQESGIRVS